MLVSPRCTKNHAVKTRTKSATLWVDCELWNEAADRLIKCSEKGKLTGRKIQVTGALANSHWKKKVGTQEVPFDERTKTNCKRTFVFELLGSIKTDDSLLDDSTELDESILLNPKPLSLCTSTKL
ncbi:hypothetical protein KF728_09525 [Candidatus Obscuribacterales bacterium]|nr:hypothetical protein [Candidatus Obscuribacterales bacterium]